ncbi:MAG: Glycine cleavage system H protein [Candidatus Anoxychlamydiales bacterium]|nr:Glycine cleavage system H protein [Candidatus Anoxychlamydiales bacterium]
MKFSNTHEWVEDQNGTAIVGITNFGRMHLGDIINIKLPNKGTKVKANEEVAVIESNKAAVDAHSPISGDIIDVNEELNKNIDLINTSPEEKGWLFKVKMNNLEELNSLMSLEEYEKKVSK